MTYSVLIVALISSLFFQNEAYAQSVITTRFGANFNKSPEKIDNSLLNHEVDEAKRVKVVRASINMLELVRDIYPGVNLTVDMIGNKEPFTALVNANAKWKAKFDGIRNLESNKELILTLRWDFVSAFKLEDANVNKGRLHSINSTLRSNYHKLAGHVLYDLRSKIKHLVIGNEPVLETLDYDQANLNIDGVIVNPMFVFYRDLAQFVVGEKRRHYYTFPVYLGAFNKLHLPGWRNDSALTGYKSICAIQLVKDDEKASEEGIYCPINQKISNPGIYRMIEYAKTNENIAGIDIHAHTEDNVDTLKTYSSEIETQLKYARERIGSTKRILVTEFSLIHTFQSHYEDQLCVNDYCTADVLADLCNLEATRPGPAVACTDAKRIEILTSWREIDFVNKAKAAPGKVSETDVSHKLDAVNWEKFFYTRPYLPKNYMWRAANLFNQYGVLMATYGYVQENTNTVSSDKDFVDRRDLTLNDLPWVYNALFVPLTVNFEDVTTLDPFDFKVRTNGYFYRTFRDLPK